MRAPRNRLRVVRWVAALCVAGLAFVLLNSGIERKRMVVFSNGSCLSIRKVTYGKDNIYYHNSVQRAAEALVPHAVWDRGFLDWLPKVGVSSVNSQILSGDDYLVVFGDFHFTPAGTRFWEFTGIDASGNEGTPLETTFLDASVGPTTNGPCILAAGTNVPHRWPIAVRIYERDTNGTRKLLAEVPAQRAHR
jgi:hypothetical protein